MYKVFRIRANVFMKADKSEWNESKHHIENLGLRIQHLTLRQTLYSLTKLSPVDLHTCKHIMYQYEWF